MRRLLFLTLTILLSVFIFNDCNNYRRLTAQSEVLFRYEWKLTEVEGQQVADSLRSSFEFTPGKLSGSTGCNWLSAGFLAGKHQTVTFAADDPVKMECSSEYAATMESKFLDALSKSTKWEINGGQLWLGDGESTLIKLKSVPKKKQTGSSGSN